MTARGARGHLFAGGCGNCVGRESDADASQLLVDFFNEQRRKRWSLPKASTLTSCKSSSPTSLLTTLLPSLKLTSPFSPARFPDYIARSASTTIKRRGIQGYATHLSLEHMPPFCNLCLYKKDCDALRCGQGTPIPRLARPELRSVSWLRTCALTSSTS